MLSLNSTSCRISCNMLNYRYCIWLLRFLSYRFNSIKNNISYLLAYASANSYICHIRKHLKHLTSVTKNWAAPNKSCAMRCFLSTPEFNQNAHKSWVMRYSPRALEFSQSSLSHFQIEHLNVRVIDPEDLLMQ